MIETKPFFEERAVLVGLITDKLNVSKVDEYLDELAFLAETAGAITLKRFTQRLIHPDSRIILRHRKAK